LRVLICPPPQMSGLLLGFNYDGGLVEVSFSFHIVLPLFQMINTTLLFGFSIFFEPLTPLPLFLSGTVGACFNSFPDVLERCPMTRSFLFDQLIFPFRAFFPLWSKGPSLVDPLFRPSFLLTGPARGRSSTYLSLSVFYHPPPSFSVLGPLILVTLFSEWFEPSLVRPLC